MIQPVSSLFAETISSLNVGSAPIPISMAKSVTALIIRNNSFMCLSVGAQVEQKEMKLLDKTGHDNY